ncbi:hypothetical protein HZH68_006853 [Vespula germanica]|uniref:Uncharacterized protein n=1 Tax=Vespula germanica TaxID=30212 RepID=A0A834NDH5_VESGE|nr:hypothetical protein HZH68_006853 [Vespula germanica]
MMSEEVALRNVPPPGNSYSPVTNSNSWQRENFSRKPSFVLGSHDVRRGGTLICATSSNVLVRSHGKNVNRSSRVYGDFIECKTYNYSILLYPTLPYPTLFYSTLLYLTLRWFSFVTMTEPQDEDILLPGMSDYSESWSFPAYGTTELPVS